MALLLTDVVDSATLSAQLGDQAMAALWAAHDRAARDLLPVHRGREIDKADGFQLLFEAADDDAAYALAYHRAIGANGLKARAGLHVGPAILTENSPTDVARGAKPPDGVGSVWGNLGKLRLELGHLDEARVCLLDGEHLLREVGDPFGLATLLGPRAQLEARRGDRGAALATLAEARDLADRVDAGSQGEVRRALAQASAAVEGP